jgi:hypothetical protein
MHQYSVMDKVLSTGACMLNKYLKLDDTKMGIYGDTVALDVQ